MLHFGEKTEPLALLWVEVQHKTTSAVETGGSETQNFKNVRTRKLTVLGCKQNAIRNMPVAVLVPR